MKFEYSIYNNEIYQYILMYSKEGQSLVLIFNREKEKFMIIEYSKYKELENNYGNIYYHDFEILSVEELKINDEFVFLIEIEELYRDEDFPYDLISELNNFNLYEPISLNSLNNIKKINYNRILFAYESDIYLSEINLYNKQEYNSLLDLTKKSKPFKGDIYSECGSRSSEFYKLLIKLSESKEFVDYIHEIFSLSKSTDVLDFYYRYKFKTYQYRPFLFNVQNSFYNEYKSNEKINKNFINDLSKTETKNDFYSLLFGESYCEKSQEILNSKIYFSKYFDLVEIELDVLSWHLLKNKNKLQALLKIYPDIELFNYPSINSGLYIRKDYKINILDEIEIEDYDYDKYFSDKEIYISTNEVLNYLNLFFKSQDELENAIIETAKMIKKEDDDFQTFHREFIFCFENCIGAILFLNELNIDISINKKIESLQELQLELYSKIEL